jgi:hypothetical protein
MDGPNFLFPRDLFARLGPALSPLVFDVRRMAAFDDATRMTPPA